MAAIENKLNIYKEIENRKNLLKIILQAADKIQCANEILNGSTADRDNSLLKVSKPKSREALHR